MADWFFLLFMVATLILQVHGQSTQGFISIDCGMGASKSSYKDSTTGITYVSDEQYIDTGEDTTISPAYSTQSTRKQTLTVRSFRNGTRNCYKLRPVIRYHKYLVRATFMYGDYDGLGRANYVKPLQFDLHVDVNFWGTVNVTDASSTYAIEVILVAPSDSVSVCLVNTGKGTPFISALELRPILDTLYTFANTTQYLALFVRLNAGPNTTDRIRYPDDPYDRIWIPYRSTYWTEISTASTISQYQNDQLQAPSVVMQTAATPVNSSVMQFYWDHIPGEVPSNEYYANFHFSELASLPSNTSRTFDIYLNDEVWRRNYTPPYLMADAVYSTIPLSPASLTYRWALNSTGRSALPPILNAAEIFTVMHLPEVATDSGDVDAITEVKGQYGVNLNWRGDPCAPKEYVWDGLNCSRYSDSSRIVSVNLSSRGLTGLISTSFANLSVIEYLDLSRNNLTGIIPDSFGSLKSLKFLDLSCNNLTGPVSASLLQRSLTGQLTFRYDDSSHPCLAHIVQKASKKNISSPVIVVISVISLIVVLAVVALVVWMTKKKQGHILACMSNNAIADARNPIPPQPVPSQPGEQYPESKSPGKEIQLDSRQFTYNQLVHMSKNFVKVIGEGGFGNVYLGHLENGKQVAIKMHSQTSAQGTNEFLAEVQNLTRIHHRNLVSFVGYCMDGSYLALIYEYMPQGSLHDHLRGKGGHLRTLHWRERLRIAVESAQGLDYLHKGCKPPIVHRDIKTSNILLSKELEAKIADFGLSKAYHSEDQTHVSTMRVVGTPGYVDPEYQNTLQLNEKSDVYSFGIVLLELITAQPPIIPGSGVHIVQRIAPSLARGDIHAIIDKRLQGDYDTNSAWKVLDLAMKCTAMTGDQRPTTSYLVMQLKESLELASRKSENIYMKGVDTNESSTFEIGGTMPGSYRPAAR